MKESWMEEIREVRMSKVKHDVYQYKANGCLFSDGVTRVFGENRVIHTDHGNIINSVMPLHDSNGLIKIGYLYSEGGEIVSIEGVPEGWKIKGILKGRDGDSAIDSYGKVITLSGCDVGYYHTIVERDIQIIDMSQCKVDIEYSRDGVKWEIDRHSEMGSDDDWMHRVRQDHYFGWKGGECPLPEGLVIRVLTRESDELSEPMPVEECHYNWVWSYHVPIFDIIGFEVIDTNETHVYAHEAGGEG